MVVKFVGARTEYYEEIGRRNERLKRGKGDDQ